VGLESAEGEIRAYFFTGTGTPVQRYKGRTLHRYAGTPVQRYTLKQFNLLAFTSRKLYKSIK
jgi:hypothetical protein